MTECSQSQFPFEAHFSRQVMGRFDGSQLTTDGGGLLLRQADRKIGLLQRVTACFTDHRRRERVEHELHQMLAQRIYGLALGYEDLNDHEQLREDPLLALLAGKREITEPLAGKSTLNRMELTPAGCALAERYHKITYSAEAIDALLVEIFLEAHRKPPTEIVLIWTPPTRRCMGGRRGASSTATTTTTIATCRCTSSAATTSCARGCGRPTRTPARAAPRKSHGSSRRFASGGRRCGSCCEPTRASVARS